MNAYQARNKRLEYIRNNRNYSNDDLLCILKVERLIGKKYSLKNLLVDIWFINNGGRKVVKNIFQEECHDNFHNYIWIRVIIQALQDYASGRPCDLGIWGSDAPPYGKLKCSSTEHICSKNAEEFLLKQAVKYEGVCGLPHGTIKRLMSKLKEDITTNIFL